MHPSAPAALLVAGGFGRNAGMDLPNGWLARALAARAPGRVVHLVAHHVDADLATLPGVRVTRVPRPFRSVLLGEPLLDAAGRARARGLARAAGGPGPVVVNGGNCLWPGAVNWVHYVHAAWPPEEEGAARARARMEGAWHRTREARAFARARLLVANSERTREDLERLYRVDPRRITVVPLGVDAERFRPPAPAEATAARAALGWTQRGPVLLFVGALGNRRKGFDILFDAWRTLCADARWDAHLAVVGTGRALPRWQQRAREAGLEGRVEFLGFRADVEQLLWAASGLASPTRYESFGLNVLEALCAGLPVVVTRTAGVAERVPAAMEELLLNAPPGAAELAERLRRWRAGLERLSRVARDAAGPLRAHTWEVMARQLVARVEG